MKHHIIERGEMEKKMRLKTRLQVLGSVLILSIACVSFVPLAGSSPGQIHIEGVFQPVQVVWQDDPLYPPNDMIYLGDSSWLANFSMVYRKNTFLFGTLNDLDGNRSTIDIWLYDLDAPPGFDFFMIEISVWPPGMLGTVIYVSSVFTIQRGGVKIVSLVAPIPIPPFIFQAAPGLYSIRLRTIITPSVNQIIVYTKVVDTRPLTLIYYPLAFQGDQGAQGVVLPTGINLNNMVRESSAFVLGTYPLREPEWGGLKTASQPLFGPTPNPPGATLDHLVSIMRAKQRSAAMIQAGTGQLTQAVVVVPDYFNTTSQLWANRWYNLRSPGGAFIPSNMPNVVYVELGYWQTVAHEITHNILNVRHSDNRANGYWVNRRIDQVNKLDLMHALPFPANLVFHQNNDVRWIKKRAIDNNLTTVRDIPSSFENLLNFFRVGADPEVLMVSGQIFKNGTVSLDDWYRFPEGLPNLELGTAGTYSVVMLDSIGQELGRTGFNATFVFELGDLEPPELVEVDVSPFTFIIPWISGTNTIQIRDAAENVLACRYVSANPPSVSVTFPNGGEVLTPGIYTITWTANDLDGDPLRYAILYSDNNGTNWLPLAMDLEETSYTWNVTDFLGGKNYLMKVIATDGVNTGEDVSDGTFVVKTHDIAVSDVTPSKTVVGQGYSVNINITVQNLGYYSENFNVTAYTNTTIITTLTNITLTSGNSTTITFTWNTTGFAKGNYTIWAYAWPVLGETDTVDNRKQDGWVLISIYCDINGDGIVDISDILDTALAFGSTPGQPRWNPNCDLNDDGIIDISDILEVALHYGQT